MKKTLIFVICLFLFVFYTYSEAVKVHFEFTSENPRNDNYELYTSWWPQENEILEFKEKLYSKTLLLPLDMKMNIIIYKNSELWYQREFVVKEGLEIKKDLDKNEVEIKFDNSLCPEVKKIDIFIDNKKYSDIDLSNTKTARIKIDHIKENKIYIYSNNYKYGPVLIPSSKKITRLFYEIKLDRQMDFNKKNLSSEIFINFYGNTENIFFKIFDKEKEIFYVKDVKDKNSVFIENLNSSKLIIYNKDKEEIFNTGFDKENINIKIFEINNIKILGKEGLFSYRVNGIRDNIKIKNIIPGPVCYVDEPYLELFKGDKKIHYQNLNQIMKKYNFINPGFSKVILRFRWSGEEKKYIQRNWDNNGVIFYPENFDSINIKNDSIYEKIYYLKPVNIDSKKEYQFRICDVTGKKSSLYPLKIFSFDDILWSEDLDNYKNRSLLNIEFILRILPVNKWDSFYLKHNFQGYPDGFDGLTKEKLVMIDKNEMLFSIKRDVYEGEKRFELWGYDKETDTYDEIYSKDFYLNRSLKIFYDYDKPEKLIQEEKYYYSFVIFIFSLAGIYFVIYFLKKKGMDIALFFKQGYIDRIFDQQVNFVKNDPYFYSCFVKLKKKIKVYSYNSNCIANIKKDCSFFNGQDEIIIIGDILEEKDIKNIQRLSSEEILKIYVFCNKMNKGDFYVKISHKKTTDKIMIIENENNKNITLLCDEKENISII